MDSAKAARLQCVQDVDRRNLAFEPARKQALPPLVLGAFAGSRANKGEPSLGLSPVPEYLRRFNDAFA